MEKINVDQARIVNPFVPAGPYRDGLLKAIETLVPFLSSRKLKNLIEYKLCLYEARPDEAAYLQAACELTVCAYFAKHFPQDFAYEPRLNGEKDVDCSMTYTGIRFNIEVKCADFMTQHAIDAKGGPQLSAHGRMHDFPHLAQRLAPLIGTGSGEMPLQLRQHMDNKLKDFLVSAHSKFPAEPSDAELNVLVVCGDGPQDISAWQGYMIGPQGLLRSDSFVAQEMYSRVDLVLLTNLYHRHHALERKGKLRRHWDMGSAFNVLYDNSTSYQKQHLMDRFADLIPTLNNWLYHHRVVGFPDNVEEILRISDFVGKLFERGIFYFQSPT